MPDFDAKPCAVFPKHKGKSHSFTLHLFPGDSREKWISNGGSRDNFRVAINGKYYRTTASKYLFLSREGVEKLIRDHYRASLGLVGPTPPTPARPNLPRHSKVWWRKREQDHSGVMSDVTGGETLVETVTRTWPTQDEHGEWIVYVIGSSVPVSVADLVRRGG